MPDPFTPAELEAGAEALTRYLEGICEDPAVVVPYTATGVVLDAVAPLIAARARAAVAEEIAAAISAHHATTTTTEETTDGAD